MSPELYLAYLIATIVIIVVPGPSVTLIIANSLRHGTRAGLMNVAGGQLGIALLITLVGFGLASVIEAMGVWFDWLRFLGAAYLIWLGWKLIRSPGAIGETGQAPKPRGGFFLQGFLVSASNPKTLVFFGAFIPQFIDPARDYGTQIAIMGATAIVVATISDALYAILMGGAGKRMSQRAMRWMSRISGGVLIGGGVWLALTRTR